MVIGGFIGLVLLAIIGIQIVNRRDKKRLTAFLENNQVTGKHKKYLALGAILTDRNDPTSSVLRMDIRKEHGYQLLESSWGIFNREDLLFAIDRLLGEEGDHYRGNMLLFDIRKGQSLRLYENLLVECDRLKFPRSQCENCQTTVAWDIERACFLARLGAEVEYLSDQETYDILKNQGAEVLKRQNWSTWEEYAASFFIGRTLCYDGEISEVMIAAVDLLKSEYRHSVWNEVELSEL